MKANVPMTCKKVGGLEIVARWWHTTRYVPKRRQHDRGPMWQRRPLSAASSTASFLSNPRASVAQSDEPNLEV